MASWVDRLPQALANARQGRGFALIEVWSVGPALQSQVAAVRAGCQAGDDAQCQPVHSRGAAGRRLDDGAPLVEAGAELSCCPLGTCQAHDGEWQQPDSFSSSPLSVSPSTHTHTHKPTILPSLLVTTKRD